MTSYSSPSGSTVALAEPPIWRKMAAGAIALVSIIPVAACGHSSDAATTPPSSEVASSASAAPSRTEAVATSATPSEQETSSASGPTELASSAYEMPEGAVELDNAYEKILAMPGSEIDAVIANEDIQQLAYWKLVLLLNGAENQRMIGAGKCQIEEVYGQNPVFHDVRNLDDKALFCALNHGYGIATSTSGPAGNVGDKARMDSAAAIRVLNIDTGFAEAHTREADRGRFQEVRDVISKNDGKMVGYWDFRGEENSLRRVPEPRESSKVVIKGTEHDSFVVKTTHADSQGPMHFRYALVPVEFSDQYPMPDFNGKSKTAHDGTIGYGHIALDDNGQPVTKTEMKRLFIPVLLTTSIAPNTHFANT